jgi:hypothetical protein
MRTRRFLCAALALFVLAASGCSSSAATPTLGDYRYGGTAQATDAGLPGEVFQAAATPAPAASSADGAIQPGPVALPSSALAAPEDRIIKTGSIHIEVANLDDSIARATDQIHALGGWMAGSNRTSSTGGGLASVTYRVPVDRFEDAVGQMRKFGKKVISENNDSQSVGGQIVDLQARIDNLKSSEKAIQAIMDKAKTIDEILTVQQHLSDVQGQIEQLTAQLTDLSDKSAYSTLTVVFEVPAPDASPSPTPQPSGTPVPWSASEQFNKAATELGGVGQSAATAAIWVVVLILPVTLALLLLLVALVLIGKLLDQLRRRWLPWMVVQPQAYRQPGWASAHPAPPLPPPSAGWPAPDGPLPPGQPGTGPQEPQP